MGDGEHPYRDIPLNDLLAMSLKIHAQLNALAEENRQLQDELARRNTPPTAMPVISIDNPSAPSAVLPYATRGIAVADEGAIGDSYADEARRYGMRIGLVVAAIATVVTLLLFIAMLK